MSLLPTMAAKPYDADAFPALHMPKASGKELARAGQTGRQFEAVFMSEMFKHMFEGIKADGVFGGGSGEEMFRSLLIDEWGKQIAAKGNGIGIGAAVQKMLLSHQEVQ